MTYSGFVYIWFDALKNMFYVGSHKGYISDSYVCSSKRMLKAYNKRPTDFRRRILKFIQEENDILFWEQYYLNMIKDSELLYNKGKYYNVKRTATGGDTTANLPNRSEVIKRRYGKKHSDAIKRAIKNRSKEREFLHQQRRRASLQKTFSDPNYSNYQDKPFDVFLNGVYYKRYRNKEQFVKENNCDRSTLIQNLRKGVWLIKQKRKHKFRPGDKLVFIYNI
jgi:hypothetical protein